MYSKWDILVAFIWHSNQERHSIGADTATSNKKVIICIVTGAYLERMPRAPGTRKILDVYIGTW